ncbi:beta-lactamase family protein [Sphingobacterium phlebotomi]|uniref:Beta-lactamase family protein n=1 Tax=Sphingobacterium phlebotomi TaxID=2605433 RepID=A0A5D4GY94_9SPHI|nr:serine hydrolase domain-containing protein [Sphingobacterium phlebotomi]TYR32235.1 beta-lactamase family protein [Sphingobacterium phlebotomi]
MNRTLVGMKQMILWIMLIGSVTYTDKTSAQTAKNLQVIAMLDSLLQQYNDNTPGFVINVVKDGLQVYSNATGMADLERGSYLDTESIFEVASVSKQFTATAVLLLVAEGKISLDDDVRRYVPRLPDYGKKITVSNLLTHTSGLRDWRNVTYLTDYVNYTRVYNQEDALNIICNQQKLNFEPGYKYSYSNSNYDLLALIVEQVSGQPFIDFATERLLKPAGMTHSTWRNDHRTVIKNRALSYIGAKGSYKLLSPMDNTAGAAGLLSTATDLQKWNIFWKNKGFGDAVAELRVQQGVLNNGRKINYALGGVNVFDRDGLKLITHGGLLTAYRTLVSYYPELDLSITYCANTREIIAPELVNKILEIYRPTAKEQLKFTSLSKEGMQKRTGVYKNPEAQQVFTVELRNDTTLAFKGGSILRAVSDTEMRAADEIYDFLDDNSVRVADEDGHVVYKKVNAYTPAEKELATFVGKYQSNDANVGISIEINEGSLRYTRNGYEWMVLKPSYQDDRIKAFSTIDNGLFTLLEFDTNNKMDLVISLPRALGIAFRKQE